VTRPKKVYKTLRERFLYLTEFQGKSKKKTIVSIDHRLAELMYSVLRNKTEYELRLWNGTQKKIMAIIFSIFFILYAEYEMLFTLINGVFFKYKERRYWKFFENKNI